MLLFLALIALATAAYFVGEVVTAPARERRNLVTRAAQYGRLRVVHGRELPRFRERAIAPVVTKLSRLMLRVNPRTSIDSVSAKLMCAGMRSTSPSAFLAAKAGGAIAGLVFGLLIASSSSGKTGLLAIFLFAFIGFYGPTFMVSMRGTRRQNAVSADLPDALDLLAVSVEAGLGFDGAIGSFESATASRNLMASYSQRAAVF